MKDINELLEYYKTIKIKINNIEYTAYEIRNSFFEENNFLHNLTDDYIKKNKNIIYQLKSIYETCFIDEYYTKNIYITKTIADEFNNINISQPIGRPIRIKSIVSYDKDYLNKKLIRVYIQSNNKDIKDIKDNKDN